MKLGSFSRTNSRSILLGALALTGWVGTGFGMWSFIKAEQVRQKERTELVSLIADQQRRIKSADELSKLHSDIAKARSEYLQVAQNLGQAQDKLQAIQGETKQAQKALDEAVENLSRRSTGPGSRAQLDTENLTTPEAISAAQRALSELGYGPLVIDGSIGPQTRQALERFERDRQLIVTGDLNPRTAEALGLGG